MGTFNQLIPGFRFKARRIAAGRSRPRGVGNVRTTNADGELWKKLIKKKLKNIHGMFIARSDNTRWDTCDLTLLVCAFRGQGVVRGFAREHRKWTLWRVLVLYVSRRRNRHAISETGKDIKFPPTRRWLSTLRLGQYIIIITKIIITTTNHNGHSA